MEVVISALAFGALPAQRTIADAAKEAGVKLFVPSEYGMPTEGGKEGVTVIKSGVAGKSATKRYPCRDNDDHPARLCQVAWTSRNACLRAFSRHLSSLYSTSSILG